MTLLLLLNEGYLTHYILDPMCNKTPKPILFTHNSIQKVKLSSPLDSLRTTWIISRLFCFNLYHYSLKLMKIVNVMSRNIRIFLIHTTGVCQATWWSGSLLGSRLEVCVASLWSLAFKGTTSGMISHAYMTFCSFVDFSFLSWYLILALLFCLLLVVVFVVAVLLFSSLSPILLPNLIPHCILPYSFPLSQSSNCTLPEQQIKHRLINGRSIFDSSIAKKMCLTQQSALVIVLTMHGLGLGLGYMIHHRTAAIILANRFLLFYYYLSLR